MNKSTAEVTSSAFTGQRRRIGPGLVAASILALALLASYAVRGQNLIKWYQPPDPASPTNLYYGWNQTSTELYEPNNLQAADDWVCTTTNPVNKVRWWGSFANWQGTNLPPNVPGMGFPNGFWIIFFRDVPAGMDLPFSHPAYFIMPPLARFYTNYTWRYVGQDYDPRTGTYESCFLFEQVLQHTPDDWWFYQDNYPTGTNIYWLSIIANQWWGTVPPQDHFFGWKTRPRDPNSLAPDDAVTYNIDAYTQGSGVPFNFQPIWWPEPANSWDLAFELITTSEGHEAKWEQVPDLSYYGMDVRATTNRGSTLPGHLLADDFQCTSQSYITNITIWGSLSNDFAPQVLTNITFTLSIHDDIPPNGPPWNMPYSMPGAVKWLGKFTNGQYTCSILASNLEEGWLTPPGPYLPNGDTICYQYDFHIPPSQAFWQQGTPTRPIVYWLDVQAQVPGPVPQFGWKTCITNWNDGAVWVQGGEPYSVPPMPPWNMLIHPLFGGPLDLAFRLNGTGEVLEEIKWSQPPVSYIPENAYNGWNEKSVYESDQVVADDWVCTNATPVTDLHWWGSFIDWPGQYPPEIWPTAFVISFWTDVPQGPNEPFSHPGRCITSFTCTTFTWNFDGWDFDPRDPMAPPEACFRFDQQLAPEEYFVQPPGTNIYWISIAAQYPSGQTIEYPWGWKTRPRDPNSLAPDDAVRIFDPTYVYPGAQYLSGTNLWWPTMTKSWDMAFVLTTQEVQTPTDDFGDAPDSVTALGYPTLSANNGAQHTVVPGVFLGKQIDPELDGQPTALADGDDINNLADEDGVALASQLIPGEAATVQVTASVPGFVTAWLDFNADRSWGTLGDQIFNNVQVIAGTTALSFNVPLTAARGTNTFARFRFCTVSNAVTTFTGPARDGEVEDYRWYIEELDFGDAQEPTFPTTYAANGARHVLAPTIFLGARIDSEVDGQPSANAKGDDNNPPLSLSDEDGVALLTPLVPGQPARLRVVTTMLGGLLNAPLNAWIDFGADGSWATPGDQICVNTMLSPGINIVNFIVPPTAAAGSNVFARFRFSTMPSPPLGDAGLAPNGEVEDYLWRIEALDFGDAPDPAYPTRLANNGAHHLPGNLFMGARVDAEADGQPNAFATGDDLAGADDEDGVVFTTALISGVPATVNVTCSAAGLLQGWIDWNQNGSWAGEQIIANAPVAAGANTISFFVPNNVPSGKTFARFRLSTVTNLTYTGYAADGEVEDYEVTLYPLKWLQVPEQGSEGVDVSLATPLADDFICSESGPITDVHMWGSFYRDLLPAGGPGSLTLTLTIYTDVPGPGYSRPGQALWSKTFNPGQYQAANNFTTMEWWHDPATTPPTWIFPGDTNMYQFDFYIDPREAFKQVEGTIYWLGVSLAGSGANFSFGWKTTPKGYAPDDACWLDTAAGGVWRPLVYGGGHPRAPESLDLAFALSGAESLFDSDFGDAPNPYPTLSASGGAQHYAVPGFRLGPAEDTEADGLPSPQALGDDLNNTDDEDGVVFTPPVLAGTQACVNVTLTGSAGLLDAWVDFNKNGAWDHPAEQIFASQALVSGANWLCFNVPTNAVLGTNFARFRLSSAGGLSPTGLAQDGEVEDYQLVIQQRRPLTNIVITNIWVTNVSANTQLVNLAWTYENGVHYQVRYAPSLGSNYVSNIFWIDIGPEVIGPAHQYQDATSTTVTQRFYRVVAPYLAP